MAAIYDVVDSIGGLIATFQPPYRKFFLGNVNFTNNPILLMWLKTGYSTNDHAASVRVNGREAGKLLPRPWVDHFIIDFEAESLIFPRTFLNAAPYEQFPVINMLEIVPVAGADDGYVLLDKVIFFHNPSL
jgi:hypothetical protein